MTASETDANEIMDQVALIDGVMRDDIRVHDDKVTMYVPTGKLEEVDALDGVIVEILEEYEHEYLISVAALE